MYFAGPQKNIDQQVEEYRADARYHRSWARRLNFTGWASFAGGLIVQFNNEASPAWLAFLLITVACWAWQHYELGKEREVREELWEYCRQSVQILHKWEGKGDDNASTE